MLYTLLSEEAIHRSAGMIPIDEIACRYLMISRNSQPDGQRLAYRPLLPSLVIPGPTCIPGKHDLVG
jgi:hypothetical protein